VTTNNKAAVKFTAAKATVTKCVVTSLAKLPLGTAKKLLTTLNCKVGKVTKASSSAVAKGNVIKTSPGNGSYATGTSITIVESSGPKPKKKK
jgi:serine/threonine-protein kinase